MSRIFFRIAGGAAILALSFFITLYVLDRFEAPPGKTILCRVPLPLSIPAGKNPLVTIGVTGKADVVYVTNVENKIMLNLDDWGRGNKSVMIDAGILLDILFDYTKNVVTVSSSGRELLRQSDKMSGEFTEKNISVGSNEIGYGDIELVFPDVVSAAQSGAANCAPRST
jgi:hypothetical protein